MSDLAREIAPIKQDLVEACADRWKHWMGEKHGPLSASVLELMRAQSYGGMCPKCGQFWEKVSVKNQFANFVYYQPACQCWKRCPGIARICSSDGKPITRHHHVKKKCGDNSFIEQEMFNRVECDSCYGEIQAWSSFSPIPEKQKSRTTDYRA